MQYSKNELIGKSGKYLPEKMRFSKDNPNGLRSNEIFSDNYQIKLFNEEKGITENDVNTLLEESHLKFDKGKSFKHSMFFKKRNVKNFIEKARDLKLGKVNDLKLGKVEDFKLVSVIFKKSESLGVNGDINMVSFIYLTSHGYELRTVLLWGI